MVLFSFSTHSLRAQFANEEELRKQADKYFEDEEYDKCYKLYSQLVAHYLKDPNLNYRLGVCMLFVEPDKKKCFPYLELANKNIKECEKEAVFYLGKAYHLNFKFDDAMKYYALYKDMASASKIKKLAVDHEIQACKNGKRLLSNLTELVISEKKQLSRENYFRSYNLSGVGGKLLVKPVDFISPVDKKKKNESIIYLPKTNDRLYYASYGEEDKTGKDIYVVTRQADGEWSKPQNIGNIINTEYDEDYPFLHPNGKVLYFASKGHNTMGGYDIFKSELDEGTGQWKTPVNMDFPINTPDDDFLFVTDSLEKSAYFSSARNNPFGKIEVYKINTERVPMDFAYINGRVLKKEAGQSIQSKIHVKNILTGQDIGNYAASDSGHYSLQLPNGGKVLYTVETPGFTVQSEQVELPQSTTLRPYRQAIFYENKKLVIQNFFTEVYNAENAYIDFLALIEQQSKMEVNYNKFKEKETVKENTTTNTVITPATTAAATKPVISKEQVDKAYGAVKDLNASADLLAVNAKEASSFSIAQKQEADSKINGALQALDRANAETDAKVKESLLAEAERLKEDADISNKTAEVAGNIVNQLNTDAANKKKEAEMVQQYAQQLEKLLKDPENKEELAKLETQKKELEDFSKAAQSKNTATVAASLNTEEENKKAELEKAIANSQKLLESQKSMQNELANIEKQIAETKDPDLLENYKSQQEELKAELQNSEKEIKAGERKVGKIKREADVIANQKALNAKMLANYKPEKIGNPVASITAGSTTTGTTVASNTKPDNSPANSTNNPAITANNPANNPNNTNNPATTTTSTEQPGFTEASVRLESELQALNKNPDDTANKIKKEAALSNYIQIIDEEIKNQQAYLSKTKEASAKSAISTNLKKLEEKKAEKKNELAVLKGEAIATAPLPPNYVNSSKRFDEQLTQLNSAKEGKENLTQKKEVLNQYIQSIDEAIKNEELALSKAGNNQEKNAITATINQLKDSKQQKNEQLASATKQLTILEEQEQNAPENYSSASVKYEQQLSDLGKEAANNDNLQKKNEVLNKYISAIDNTLKAEQQKLNDTRNEEEKASIATNIKKLEEKRTEKQNELKANTAQLTSIAGGPVTAVQPGDTSNQSNTTTALQTFDVASEQYEQELATLNKKENSTETLEQKNNVLKNYIKTIDKALIAEQQKLNTTQEEQAKLTAEANIKKLQEKKAEKTAEYTTSNTQLVIANVAKPVENDTPENFPSASDAYEQKLNSLDKLPQGTASLGEKEKVLNQYIQSIDRAIADKQTKAAAAPDNEKEALTNNIKTLENKRAEKVAEAEKNKNLLAANQVKETGTTGTAGAVTEDFATASGKYEEELNNLNAATTNKENVSKKQEVLQQYIQSIDRALQQEQQKLTAANTNEQEKQAITTNIQQLETKKEQRNKELEANKALLADTALLAAAANPVDSVAIVLQQLPENYNEASVQLDNQLQKLNEENESAKNYEQKNQVLTAYVTSIDKEIESKTTLLSKTRRKKKKAVISAAIQELEAQKSQKTEAIGYNAQKLDSITLVAKRQQRMKDSLAASNPEAYDNDLLTELTQLNNTAQLNLTGQELALFTATKYTQNKSKELKSKADQQQQQLSTIQKNIATKAEALGRSVQTTPTAAISEEEIKNKTALADQLNAEALEVRKNAVNLSPEEKEAAVEKIASLEKEADEIRLVALRKQWARLQQAYTDNDSHINGINTTITKTKNDEIMQARILVKETAKLYEEALKIRADGKKESSLTSRVAVTSMANEKIGTAIEKQKLMLSLFKKYNKDYVHKASSPADLVAENKNRAAELKKEIKEAAAKRNQALQLLAEANKAEMLAIKEKLIQLEQQRADSSADYAAVKEKAMKAEVKGNDHLATATTAGVDSTARNNFVAAAGTFAAGITSFNEAITMLEAKPALAANTANNKDNAGAATVSKELSQEQLEVLKTKPEYQNYLNLTNESQKLNIEAEANQKQSQEFYDIATKNLKESNDLKIMADSLPAGTQKDSIQQRVVFLEQQSAQYKLRGDSVHELAQQSKKSALLKQTEALALAENTIKGGTTVAVNTTTGTTSQGGNETSNEAPVNHTEALAGKGFNISNKSPYSSKNPIPIDEKLPDGLIFRVQIGAFKKLLPDDAFNGLSPVGGERAPNGFIRYQIGLFNQFDKANAVKNDMRNLGYRDAFVVAYLNGKRINLNEALDQLKGQGIATLNDNNSTAGISAAANIPKPATLNQAGGIDPAPKIMSEMNAIQGMFFTVQIGVYNGQVRSSQVRNLEPLYREKLPTGLYRYTAGIYSNIDKVKADRAKVNALGMNDAFVSAYLNGQKIKISDALEKIKSGEKIEFPKELPINFNGVGNVGPVTTQNVQNIGNKEAVFNNGVAAGPAPTAENGVKSTEEGISYRVQVGAYRNKIPNEVANNFMKVKSWPVKTIRINELYVYTIGSFIEMKYAKKLQQEVLNLGLTDAFVVVYKDGKKLFGADALKYLNQ